jgi:hypothetical protein
MPATLSIDIDLFSRVERSFFKSSFPHSLIAEAVGLDPRHHIKNL